MEDKDIIFVGYYTKNTPYEEVMDSKLLPCLQKWNLKYCIKGIDDLGNWNKNTAYKATFIYDMLQEHKKDIVILDADATITKYPQLFFEIPEQYDIAIHKLDWWLHWHGKLGEEKRELLSGTMLFRYNEKTLKLCQQYIIQCKENPGIIEQRVLDQVIQDNKEINIYDLPAEYCAVLNHDYKLPEYIKDPVIVHWQVSRQYKK